jgi:hypothetical protein
MTFAEAFTVALTMPKKGANLGEKSDSIVPGLDGETVSKGRIAMVGRWMQADRGLDGGDYASNRLARTL